MQEDVPLSPHHLRQEAPQPAGEFEREWPCTKTAWQHTQAPHAILLPGRIPGYKRTDVQLLPSSTTKRQVWQQYCSSLHGLSTAHHQVAYSTFCSLWRRILPQITVTKPMSDLCWICQSNSAAIMKAANQPEEQKSEVRKHTLCNNWCTLLHAHTEHTRLS